MAAVRISSPMASARREQNARIVRAAKSEASARPPEFVGDKMFGWVLGVGLDAVATLTGTVGKQLLRYAATTRNPWYYPLGLFFTGIIDPIFDAAAYSFAAASIVTACAGLVIVWNVLLAPYTLGEPLTPSRKWAAALICVGTVLTGLFGNHVEVICPCRHPTRIRAPSAAARADPPVPWPSQVHRTVDEYLTLFTR